MLTYKATDGQVGQSNFDPLVLENIFKDTIEDLKKLTTEVNRKLSS